MTTAAQSLLLPPTMVTTPSISIWVIPSRVNKNFHMTITELDGTWYAGSTFGFVMPDKIFTLIRCMVSWLWPMKMRGKIFFCADCYLIPCNLAILNRFVK